MSRLFLIGRAVVAVVLMIGFYTLGLTIALGLLYIPYAALTSDERLDFRLGLVCVVGGLSILWSLVPRIDRFVPPGPRLEPREQPRLFERLRKLAVAVGQDMPVEVYLSPEMNAWVAQRGGIMGFGSRRVMGLGLPLLEIVSVPEFEAILAHEFGHYHAGDTRLGPWVYKTRGGIGRAIGNLGKVGQIRVGFLSIAAVILQKPFIWYGNFFLRITHAISRAQELSADRLAATTVGAQALVGGLRALHRNSGAYDYYLNAEIAPALRKGFLPPLLDGFSQFLHLERIAAATSQQLEKALTEPTKNPYDTHPPLAQRLAALEGMPAGKTVDDGSPASTLLDHVGGLEAQLASKWIPSGTALKPLPWKETGVSVYLPQWQATCKDNSAPLGDLTLNKLPDTVAALPEFARKTAAWTPSASSDALAAYALSLLGAAFCCALYRDGWEIDNQPGTLMLKIGDMAIDPFDLVNRMRKGEFTKDKWEETMAHFGLNPEMPLGVSA
jgi:Zn-dependent protease with chaperone function